jgi:hypothetical protein
MEFLNAEARQKLANELVDMKYERAKQKLLKMDPQGRLAFFRNTQRVGSLMTKVVLPSFGAAVTLVEKHSSSTDPISSKIKGDNKMVEVIVEPTADNKS